MRFAMIFAHILMGKLNLEQSTFFLDPPNRPNLFGLMLVAALVVPPPVPCMGPTATSVAPEATMATFASFGVAARGNPISDLKIGKTKHAATQCCIPWHQRCTSGPIWGVVAPPTTKYPAYCSICAGPAGSTQCGNRRLPGGKCEDGGTLFSQWTGLPNIGTALGPPRQTVVTKYPFGGCPSPEIHHCPRVQELAQAAPAAGTGRPRAPKSWPR